MSIASSISAEWAKRGKLTKQWHTFVAHLDSNRNYHPESMEDMAAAVRLAMHAMTAMALMCRGITTEEQFIAEFDGVFGDIAEAMVGDPRCAGIAIEMARQKRGDDRSRATS